MIGIVYHTQSTIIVSTCNMYFSYVLIYYFRCNLCKRTYTYWIYNLMNLDLCKLPWQYWLKQGNRHIKDHLQFPCILLFYCFGVLCIMVTMFKMIFALQTKLEVYDAIVSTFGSVLYSFRIYFSTKTENLSPENNTCSLLYPLDLDSNNNTLYFCEFHYFIYVKEINLAFVLQELVLVT